MPAIEDLIGELFKSTYFMEDGPTISRIINQTNLDGLKIVTVNNALSGKECKYYVSCNENSYTLHSSEAIKTLEYFMQNPSEKDKKSLIEYEVMDRLKNSHCGYNIEEESDIGKP